jgi:hypothetical protein
LCARTESLALSSSARRFLKRPLRGLGHSPNAEIPHSRKGQVRESDDELQVDALVIRVSLDVPAIAFASWVVLSFAIVVGRLRFDHAQRDRSQPLSDRLARRLVRRAGDVPAASGADGGA